MQPWENSLAAYAQAAIDTERRIAVSEVTGRKSQEMRHRLRNVERRVHGLLRDEDPLVQAVTLANAILCENPLPQFRLSATSDYVNLNPLMAAFAVCERLQLPMPTATLKMLARALEGAHSHHDLKVVIEQWEARFTTNLTAGNDD